MAILDRVAFLKTTDLLAGVPDGLLRQIAERMEEIGAKAGTTLFREGEPGDAVYVVMGGTLRLEKDGIPLVACREAECVGKFALIDDAPRSASAIAETDVRLLKWEREEFQKALSQSPEIGLGILKILMGKLRQDVALQVEARLEQERRRLEGVAEALKGISEEFVGESKALRRVQEQLAEVAPTDVTVLIWGETGTGKGLAARTIHESSTRHKGPLIPVNCGAIPENLVESELFGHERGAFTGAVRRKLGKVELAEGGTLFLDEIGDMSLEAQAKVLRLLEERTFERVGGIQTLQAHARVIAATNRALTQMVEAKQFREDLYFRLQVFPVRLPPLRERREDIPALASHFLKQWAAHLNKAVSRLTPQAWAFARAYDWPGNVRELEHVIQRAVIVCRGPAIQVGDLALGGVQADERPAEEVVSLEEHERRYIREVLEQTRWVVRGSRGAAALLGMPGSTLQSRMKKLGIVRP